MKTIPLLNNDEPQTCWWCKNKKLTAEHKFKKTDLERLYGKNDSFNNLGVSLIDYRSKSKPKKMQSSNSKFAKFEPSLCQDCNNAKSQKSDFAYEKLINYYLLNEEKIKSERTINLEVIYKEKWFEEKLNVYRYVMKHIGCRMVENNLKPFQDTINFLNGNDMNNHLKISFQIKPYKVLDIETLFKGPFIPIVTNSILNDVFAICGWFTVKNFTINYLYEWGVDKFENSHSRNLPIEITDYSGLNTTFKIDLKTLGLDFANIIEKLEFYPYEPQKDEIKFYYDLKNKNIC